MTAELKRYDLFATGPDYDAFFSDIVETPEGKYVRFADVEAYTQSAIARAKRAEAERDEWRKISITKIEMADSTAFRDNDATIATLQARVRELESVFSHLYGQAVWLRGDQAYRDFARAFIKRMSALRIKCVSRQELAKIEGKTE